MTLVLTKFCGIFLKLISNLGSAPRPTGGYPGSAPPAGGYPGQAGAAPPGGYPGYGAPQQGPPVDPQVQQWFNAVDSDRSGHISASELQKALVNGNWSNFSEEACRMMIGKFNCFCFLNYEWLLKANKAKNIPDHLFSDD